MLHMVMAGKGTSQMGVELVANDTKIGSFCHLGLSLSQGTS
jgi:hypothetical protein